MEHSPLRRRQMASPDHEMVPNAGEWKRECPQKTCTPRNDQGTLSGSDVDMSCVVYPRRPRLHLWLGLLTLTVPPHQATADPHNGFSDAPDVFHPSYLLNETICPSKECQNLSSQMLSLIDHNVKPCDDFYQHACGGLGDSPEMLEHDAGRDVDRILRDQIQRIKTSPGPYLQLKKFYESCVSSGKSMNEVEARAVVGTVGKFYNEVSWTKSSFDLTDLLVNLLAVGSTPLFDVMLDVSEDDNTRFDLMLIAPIRRSLVLPDTDACLTKEHPSSQHTYNECRQRDTLNFIANVGEAFQALNNFPVGNADISPDDFKVTIDYLRDNIITVIEKYTPFESDVRRDLAMKKYSYMNITELQSKYPLIKWAKLLNSIVHQDPADSKVQVYFEYYFHMLFRHLSEVEPRLLHNALLAMFVTEIYFDIVNHRSGNREEYCLTVTKNLLPDVASSLYLQTFSDDTAVQIEQVFDQVKGALEQQIKYSSWLDEQSRESSLEKLRSLEVVSGGGRNLLGDTRLLGERMNDHNMNETTFLTNTIKLLKRKRKLTYALYSKNTTVPEQMWTYFVNPLDTTEPIYYHSNNIVVPYAVLPTGRLSKVLPQFKTAEMGMMIAKLIAHQFDCTGIYYRLKGVNDILSEDQAKKYSSIKDCVWKQVSKLDRTIIKHRRDILQTVNDVIADQTALKMALEAFKADNMTKQNVSDDSSWEQKGLQLFFLSVAQMSCKKNITWDSPAPVYQQIKLPPSARINLLFNQLEAFSTAFDCTPGSRTIPTENERCPAFPEGYTEVAPQHTFYQDVN